MSEINSDASPAKPAQIQDFIFARELSEVYLLLDHISGRWDKSLATVKPPLSEGGGDANWIEKICQIGWPSPKGTDALRAEQAATLINAKDRLNAAAMPANGATIAFTLLVVGDDSTDEPWWRRLVSLWRRRTTTPALGAAAPAGASVAVSSTLAQDASSDSWPTRMELARAAYPGLISTAASFESRIRFIVFALVVWLAFTCWFSWHVTAGNEILAQLDAIHAERRDIAKKIEAAESALAMPASKSNDNVKASPVANAYAIPRLCGGSGFVPAVLATGKLSEHSVSVADAHLCDALKEVQQEHAAISGALSSWLGSWNWLLFRHDSATFAAATGASKDAFEDNGRDEVAMRLLIHVFTGAVLPFFYGVLGAGAAVVRDLSTKTRESLLSPRDSTLAFCQLALGAIVGACIGLYVSPTGAHGDSVIATFTLTGSALSFLAGFGVESMFVALESVVKRVFNNPDLAKKA